MASALGEWLGYLFGTCPTFKSASTVGVKITLNVRVCRNGVWTEHEESVTEPSRIKDLLMRYMPDKCTVRTTYRGQEIERASF